MTVTATVLRILLVIAFVCPTTAVLDSLADETVATDERLTSAIDQAPMRHSISRQFHDPSFGRSGDGWPRSVFVTGIVRDVIPGYHGFGCAEGSLAIETSATSSRLPHAVIYAFDDRLVVGNADELIGKQVRVRLRKLTKASQVHGNLGTFDTAGSPMYYIRDWQTWVVLNNDEQHH